MFAKFAVAVMAAFFATAGFAKDSSVTFSNSFARPSVGQLGAAYFTVTSSADDAITGVMSDCCGAVELHRTEKINGVMSMRRISELLLKKNTPLEAQPGAKGGQHLMLIGPSRPLVEGESVVVTFSFKKAPSQTVRFPVVAESAASSHTHELH